jgi:hypothetical protein
MRQVLTAVCVMFVSVLVQAQDRTSITADRRQREGTFTSASFQVPANTAAGMMLELRADISAADLFDPLKALRISVAVEVNGVWTTIASSRWRGQETTEPPFIRVLDLSVLRGRNVRLEVEIPERMQVGATLALVPAPPEPCGLLVPCLWPMSH